MPRKGPATLEDRLNRIEGQIKAINKMIKEGAASQSTLMQLQAAISALESLRLEIVKREIRDNIVGQLDQALTQLK